MIKSKWILTIVLFMPYLAHAQADVSAEDLKNFDNVKLVQDACGIDETTGAIRGIGVLALGMVGHPIKSAKQIIPSRYGRAGIWEYLNDDTRDALESQYIKAVKGNSCYTATGEYLRYQNLSIEADRATVKAFGDDDVRYGNSYEGCSDAQYKLYQRCSQFDYPTEQDEDTRKNVSEIRAAKILKQVRALTGRGLIFNDRTVVDIYHVGVNQMLKAMNPQNCSAIEVIDQTAIAAMIKADGVLRAKIKAAGYKIN